LRTRGFPLIVFSWAVSIAVNHTLTQFKSLGPQYCSSSPLLHSPLSTFQTIERMFTIYTPTATVVSAYLNLTLLLGMFGCTKRVASDSSSAKDYLDSKNESLNLYASAFDALDRVLAAYVLAEVRSLKSIFLKIGQYVAGRPDLVSGLWADTLECLHDNCPKSSDLHVRTTVEACLSASTHKEDRANGKARGKRIKRLEDLFESFDMHPLSSGCVAQTHRATMRIGGRLEHVRVKVQHAAVEATLMTDLSAALFIVKTAARFDPKWKVSCIAIVACLLLRNINIYAMAVQVLLSLLEVWKLTLLEELDFRIEAKHLMEVSHSLALVLIFILCNRNVSSFLSLCLSSLSTSLFLSRLAPGTGKHGGRWFRTAGADANQGVRAQASTGHHPPLRIQGDYPTPHSQLNDISCDSLSISRGSL
jgi:hypothetical protein